MAKAKKKTTRANAQITKSKSTNTKTVQKAKTKSKTKKSVRKSSAALPKGKSKSASKKSGSQKLATYKGVAIGAAIPDFQVASTSGHAFGSANLKGKITILYFYPKDNTPGCTLEGYDFKARHADIESLGAQVIGVSRDSIRSHSGFKSKCGFPFELLSDENDHLGKIFDVIQMKKLYGRVFEGIERSTFVIDADGRLRHEWRRVKVDGHAAEVVDYIRNGMKE